METRSVLGQPRMPGVQLGPGAARGEAERPVEDRAPPFDDDRRGDGDGLRDGLRLLLGVLPCCGRAASAVGEKAFAFAERRDERRGAILRAEPQHETRSSTVVCV